MQPFEGIRVLDLTHVLAGPFCAFQLATLGADVIKVEPPDNPDMTRDEGSSAALNAELTGTYFIPQATGKRSLVLDLKSSQGRDVFIKLVATADVVIQNYTGSALDRLGLGYNDLAQIRPDLVHCSLTGYGRTGPKAEHPAYDLVIQAYTGLMYANGWGDDGDRPLRVGPPVIDYGTGIQAAFAVAAALFQRQRTGKGQKIDLAMADAALMLMTAHVGQTLATGKTPPAYGNENVGRPSNSAYPTQDGWIVVAAYTKTQFSKFMRILGYAGRAEEILTTSKEEYMIKQDDDRQKIARALTTKTAEEWESLLNAQHIPAARARRIDETLREPQTASRQFLQSYGTPPGAEAPLELPTAAFSFAYGGPRHSRPPPGFGSDSDNILSELGYSADEISALRVAKTLQ
jgi:crotonobetainyl-CoA:carnitine CoA-transferase CaiB-like acyl-CoA transferase